MEIPWELYMTIIKLQASEEVDFNQACIRVSELIDENSEKFKNAVQSMAKRLLKSQFMSRVNKSKDSWEKKGYNTGYKDGDEAGYQRGVKQYRITYPCSVCGVELTMMPGAQDHEAMKKLLKQAEWAHSSCLKKLTQN